MEERENAPKGADSGQRLLPIDRDICDFLSDCSARILSPRTVALYREKLSHWRALWDITQTQDITPGHIRDGLNLLARTHNPGGVHVHYRVLRTFLRWCINEGILEVNPLQRIRPPKLVENPLPPLNLEHLKAMLGTCGHSWIDRRDKALLLFLLDSGVRASELCSLDISDLSLEDGVVTIRQGKGRKRRSVCIGHKTRHALLRYLRLRPDQEGPLFVTQKGRRFTYWILVKVIRRRAEKAGVPAPALHAFRRAFALASLRNGMDVYSLQRLMGHADLEVLRRYLALESSDLVRAHKEAGPVDRWL